MFKLCSILFQSHITHMLRGSIIFNFFYMKEIIMSMTEIEKQVRRTTLIIKLREMYEDENNLDSTEDSFIEWVIEKFSIEKTEQLLNDRSYYKASTTPRLLDASMYLSGLIMRDVIPLSKFDSVQL